MDFLQLHVIVNQLLKSSILLFGTIFGLYHPSKVLVIFQLFLHLLNLLFSIPNLLEIAIKFSLFLDQDLVFRWFSTFVYNLLLLFYFQSLLDKALQLFDYNEYHISKLYILRIQGLNILLRLLYQLLLMTLLWTSLDTRYFRDEA